MKYPWLFPVAMIALSCLANPILAQTDKKTPVEKEPKAEPANVQEVIAEGVGKTVDDAIKDALRSAVREVLGAVVDQETRLKNDQIIDDKVLTASSGYVAGYEKVKLKEEGGLFRITIKAKVERAELVDKLRSLKITVRAVDPARVLPKEDERRFSDDKVKEMTKEEMVRNKTEIIQDALVDLPKILGATARMPDRFDFNEATGTLKVDVRVEADMERYVAFLKRLTLRLDKLALGKVTTATVGKPKDLDRGDQFDFKEILRGFAASGVEGLSGPDLRGNADSWCLWVLTNMLANGTGTRWTGYVLDADFRKCLVGLPGELHIQVVVRDADGKAIAESILPLHDPAKHPHSNPWLGKVQFRMKQNGNHHTPMSPILSGVPADYKITQEKTINVLIHPLALHTFWQANAKYNGISYLTSRTFQHSIRLDKEEMKRVKDIRCAVLFRPETGK